MTAATAPSAGRPARTRSGKAKPKLDAIAADAVEMARAALEEVTEPGQVGEHLRVEATGDRIVDHVFACAMPGYRGWSWHVTVVRASRAKVATVAETALLPGEGALLAPDWEPWSERLRPSDVGADDLLPYRDEDERLEFGYEQTDDEEADRVALWELGLGRPRVLSPQGRAEAAERWVGGEFGPRETSSRGRKGTVTANCSSCGFLSQLSGALRGEFGVCTNEWSPADGRVVHLQYGCGAHSETGKEEAAASEFAIAESVVVDELQVDYELIPTSGDDTATDADASADADGSTDNTATDKAATDKAATDKAATDKAATDGGAADSSEEPTEN
ncbi:hypothetical protein BF93_04320 [Brachybacterium phenoliresistens]|uniref:DUF3027 domain-containing protein n=1 Tax=Brachybacterium phenoliresistens TaxID=396014 RepID=Z9JR59_9MICO|nr:DUF3027 domain-containing protein [Brachybacterium phenoliresistens]EWS80237.1 hypothetical protein BF93_04320 [Brachybacterium phenoliresistens]